jgi:hypothetical protein
MNVHYHANFGARGSRCERGTALSRRETRSCVDRVESERGAHTRVISDRVVELLTSATQKASSETLSNIVVDDPQSLRSMTVTLTRAPIR